jgi:hypothetical protein
VQGIYVVPISNGAAAIVLCNSLTVEARDMEAVARAVFGDLIGDFLQKTRRDHPSATLNATLRTGSCAVDRTGR